MSVRLLPSYLVFGVREPKPLQGFPPGKVRLRMRNKEFMRARVRTPDGIREFTVKEIDGHWMPSHEIGRNA